jgi:alginate O-acetyltransferase complex protein AlgJ
MTRLHPLVERTLVILFISVLWLPLVGMVLNVDRGDPSDENRTLASWPTATWDWQSFREVPDGLTRYFEDHFAFRQRLVRWQAAARLRAFGVSSSDAVINGRDGWLFYADDGALDDYAEAPPFTSAELEVWRRTLQDTSDWLGAQGIAYLFVISPDKHVVYPEFMPDTIRPTAVSRIDQLVEHLRRHSTVRMLDLRPALLAGKQRERIYHRTDTHWNDRGAFIGYQQIMQALARDVPGLRLPARDIFEPRTVRSQGLDLAGMLGLTRVLAEEDLLLVPRRPAMARIIEPTRPNRRLMHARVVTETPTRGPRAVVFMDSFGAGLIPFLSEDFSRVVYLWQPNMDPAVVRDERADVVIQEWVGRRLSTVLPYNPIAALPAGHDGGAADRPVSPPYSSTDVRATSGGQ